MPEVLARSSRIRQVHMLMDGFVWLGHAHGERGEALPWPRSAGTRAMTGVVETGFAGTDRFEIVHRLGVGGFGVVYRALDRRHNRQVALKVLHQRDASALYRFKREFRALADLSHPNLVTLHELFSDGEQWFFTMELLDGDDFLSHVRAERYDWDAWSSTRRVGSIGAGGGADDPWVVHNDQDVALGRGHSGLVGWQAAPPAGAREISSARRLVLRDGGAVVARTAQPTADALAATLVGEDPSLGLEQRLRAALEQLVTGVEALHRSGRLHRDIKPPNVIVARDGRVVLLDFGLVTDLGGTRPADDATAGTVVYMAPEQLVGGKVSPASDWYAVGVMLYEALTGFLPYDGDIQEVAVAKQLDDPPPPLRVDPGCAPDLSALAMELLARDPGQRPTGEELLRRLPRCGKSAPPRVGSSVLPAARSVPPSEGPFVGRERELTGLRQAFAATREGRSSSVFVHGPSGIGKTGLVHRLGRELAERDDAIVLRGRCDERESVPFKALDRLIDDLCTYLQGLPAVQADALMPRHVHLLARLFPVLRLVSAVQRAPGGSERELRADPHEVRRLGCSALRELLARLADRGPLVLVLDDLQWGDLDSAQLLLEVLRPPDPPVLLLIACYRTGAEPTSAFLRAFLAEQPAERREIAVDALTADEAIELARALAERPLSSEEMSPIVRDAAGNPFFIAEFLRFVQQTQSRRPEELGQGLSLERVVMARVQRLSESANRLLEVVAVAGGPVGDTVAIAAARLGEEAQAALAALRSTHLVRASAGAEDRIEAYHDRIRETIAGELPAARTRDIHRRLAEALERAGCAEPEVLIRHHCGADQLERAGELAAAAAHVAAEGLAFERAVALYRQALELRRLEPREERVLRAARGDALANAGRGSEAATEYLAVAASTPRDAALELLQKAGQQLLISGRIDQGLEVIGRIMPTYGLRLRRDPRMAALSLAWRRARLWLRGLGFQERRIEEIPAAVLQAIDSGHALSRGLGLVDGIRGSDVHTHSLLMALAAGEPRRIIVSLTGEVNYTASLGSKGLARATTLLEKLRDLRQSYDSPVARGLTHMAAGFAAHVGSYDFARALGHYDACVQVMRECPGASWEVDAAAVMGLDPLWYMGSMRELARRAEELLHQARQRGNRWASNAVCTAASHAVWLAADRPAELVQLVEQAMAEWSQRDFQMQHFWELWALTHADLYAGDGPAAWQRIRARWPALRQSLLMTIEIVRIDALGCAGGAALGAAEAATGREQRRLRRVALGHARRLGRLGPVWSRALGNLIAAGAIAPTDPASAGGVLESAIQGFEVTGMRLYAAAARWRLGELRGGQDGRALVQRAEEFMRSEEVVRPDRITAMLAPGFGVRPLELPAPASTQLLPPAG
jgi:serine/threonine protein kinase/tetratricopeptide (TPR) repeat protein